MYIIAYKLQMFYFYETAAYKGTNICTHSYNFPGLLVEYIINMQQDPNALFSQSLGATSNSENKNCANFGRELFVLLLF